MNQDQQPAGDKDSPSSAATKPTLILSDEQQVCVNAAVGTMDNLLISACAGGAKTTTMCAIARAVGPGRSVVALAFNKDAATALAQKMPYFVSSQTFHSFCYDALGRHLGRKPKADAERTRWFLKDLVPDWKERRDVEDNVLTLVSRFKSTTASTQCEKELRAVADRFDIDATPHELRLAEQVLDKCLDPASIAKSVDFDDMLWLCLRLNAKFPQVALVLLDEAQDTNGVQRELLRRILGKVECQMVDTKDGFVEERYTSPARLIAVGDPHQSIYGFRGADHDAMRALRDDFAMRELQLSVSYRCSQSVVKEAQKYL